MGNNKTKQQANEIDEGVVINFIHVPTAVAGSTMTFIIVIVVLLMILCCCRPTLTRCCFTRFFKDAHLHLQRPQDDAQPIVREPPAAYHAPICREPPATSRPISIYRNSPGTMPDAADYRYPAAARAHIIQIESPHQNIGNNVPAVPYRNAIEGGRIDDLETNEAPAPKTIRL